MERGLSRPFLVVVVKEIMMEAWAKTEEEEEEEEGEELEGEELEEARSANS